ncbi:MAG: metal-dependent transcriptional regulator [Anaerolineaceae bacterium]
MKIQEAAENYLETILILQHRRGPIRSIDVVNEMGYSKPTVSVVMKKFRENGYIEMDSAGYITLTDAGLEIAQRMYERHNMIAEALMALGVDEKTAYKDSCKIEHDISDVSFACMKEHYIQHGGKL